MARADVFLRTPGTGAKTLLHDFIGGCDQPFGGHENAVEMDRPRAAGRQTDELWRSFNSHARQVGGHRHQDLPPILQCRAEDDRVGKFGPGDPRRITVEHKAIPMRFDTRSTGVAKCCLLVVKCEMPTVANARPAIKSGSSSSRQPSFRRRRFAAWRRAG